MIRFISGDDHKLVKFNHVQNRLQNLAWLQLPEEAYLFETKVNYIKCWPWSISHTQPLSILCTVIVYMAQMHCLYYTQPLSRYNIQPLSILYTAIVFTMYTLHKCCISGLPTSWPVSKLHVGIAYITRIHCLSHIQPFFMLHTVVVQYSYWLDIRHRHYP